MKNFIWFLGDTFDQFLIADSTSSYFSLETSFASHFFIPFSCGEVSPVEIIEALKIFEIPSKFTKSLDFNLLCNGILEAFLI